MKCNIIYCYLSRTTLSQALTDMFRWIQADVALDDSGAINYLSTRSASKDRIARAEQVAKRIRKLTPWEGP